MARRATRKPPAKAKDQDAPAPRFGGRRLDAMPDRVDARDWFYQPRLTPLPQVLVNCDRVPDILDQGREGACTGFALAAVVNFLLRGRWENNAVSPRMLYEMARRYDEWPGERYDGSSARGAMKGWVRHGVCLRETWPDDAHGPQHLTPEVSEQARAFPGGAFYRVMQREIRDMHAALAEVGILYVTLMVHDGWTEPGPRMAEVEYSEGGQVRRRRLPVITRPSPDSRADGGHAVALVGYTDEGFIVQNSWGPEWGAEGFALLPYDDWALHATDVWAAQLGVPVRGEERARDMAVAGAGAARMLSLVPLSEIRPFVVNVGNNGRLSENGDYWTTPQDVHRLFHEVIQHRTAEWPSVRVMLYLHGGLNDERAAARRVLAMRDVMLANHIYPVHVMWESGAVETVRGMIEDLFTSEDARAGNIAEWMRRARQGLVEAKDRSLELTLALPGGALWREMKENAGLSAVGPDGAARLMANEARAAWDAAGPAQRARWELHVVGHSAGAIYAANIIDLLLEFGMPLRSLQFMAPAATTALFAQSVLPHIGGPCPMPEIYLLSDAAERDDSVGLYGKSLLYLVSNAFEARRETPLLGMRRFLAPDAALGEGFASDLERTLGAMLEGHVVTAGMGKVGALGLESTATSHGGFDNDTVTMNSILRRILGAEPARPFLPRDLAY